MKVYIIKRNNNTYYKRYFENYIQFEDEIAFAEIYTKKSSAENTMDFITRNKYKFNILPKELSVVECDLIEPIELADYTKQVRKELISKLTSELKNKGSCSMETNGDINLNINLYKLNEILEKLEGNTNE